MTRHLQRDRGADRRRQARRESQHAVLGLAGQDRAEGEEAERGQPHREHVRDVHERLRGERVGGEQAEHDGDQGRVAGHERAQPLTRPPSPARSPSAAPMAALPSSSVTADMIVS